MKNTLLLLRREEDPPGKAISLNKKARFRALGGTGVIGAKPLIATKVYHHIHMNGLPFTCPRVQGEGSPCGCNPDRAIASVNRCSSLVSYPITDTPIYKGSEKTERFRQSLPKL